MQTIMSTAVMWSKSKPDVKFQYGGRSCEFNGMSSQSHLPHCRVLPLGEFTVTIPEPHATLQGVRIPSAILTVVRHILFFVFNAVSALTSGNFRILSDTLSLFYIRCFEYIRVVYVGLEFDFELFM